MNEKGASLRLRSFMKTAEGWGRAQGREVFQKLLRAVEEQPEVAVFRISLESVERTDISFASEAIVELAKRFRGQKGFCLCDVADDDLLENWEAAASREDQPLTVRSGNRVKVIGSQPSQGNIAAFDFALKREEVTAAELASGLKLQITNASMKLKQLWEQGFLLRRQAVAASGGIEFIYFRIA